MSHKCYYIILFKISYHPLLSFLFLFFHTLLLFTCHKFATSTTVSTLIVTTSVITTAYYLSSTLLLPLPPLAGALRPPSTSGLIHPWAKFLHPPTLCGHRTGWRNHLSQRSPKTMTNRFLVSPQLDTMSLEDD